MIKPAATGKVLRNDGRIFENFTSKRRWNEHFAYRTSVRRADVSFRSQQMKRQLNSAHDKLTRLQKHQCVKAESISSRLEKLKEEHKLVFSELTQSQRKAEEYDSSTREYEEKVSHVLVIQHAILNVTLTCDDVTVQTKELKMQESVDSAGLEDLFNKISTEISIYQNAIEKAMSAGRLKG